MCDRANPESEETSQRVQTSACMSELDSKSGPLLGLWLLLSSSGDRSRVKNRVKNLVFQKQIVILEPEGSEIGADSGQTLWFMYVAQ